MKIILEPQVALNLETMVGEAGYQEISGIGFVRREGNDFYVYDFMVFDVGSRGYTEIRPKDLMQVILRDDAENARVWWHRHPVGDGIPGPHNWSGTDNQTINKCPLGGIPEIIKWSISIVRTPLGWVGRVDNHIKKTTKHVPVEPNVSIELMFAARELYQNYMSQSRIPESQLILDGFDEEEYWLEGLDEDEYDPDEEDLDDVGWGIFRRPGIWRNK